MTESVNNLIGNFDPLTPEDPSKRESRVITQIPTKDKPLIFKVLTDPRYENGRKMYRPTRYFPHMVGNDPKKDTRDHACRSIFGEDSPENNRYWELKKEFSSLKKQNRGDSQEGKRVEAELKLLKPKNRGYLMIIEPGSATIKALRVGQQVIDQLVGREGNEYVKAVPSVLKKMAADGYSPYDVGQNKPTYGWLRLYKEGEGITTAYTLEALKENVTVEVNGRKVSAEDYVEREVNPKILRSEVTLDDFPDVLEYESRFAWTKAECEAFVKSGCTVVPDKAKPKQRNSNGRFDETDEASQQASASLDDFMPPGALNLVAPVTATKTANDDEIPF